MNFETETPAAMQQAFDVLERYGVNPNRIRNRGKVTTPTTEGDVEQWYVPQDVPQTAIDELKELAGVHVK